MTNETDSKETENHKTSSSAGGKGEHYREAGVNIAAGAALVQNIKPLARATRTPGAVSDLGGFGGLFDLKATGFSDPILVSATDGVGTKLKLAIETDNHSSVGIDLVAMCVNDLIVQGAQPLFFLDYIAVGKLDVDKATDIVASIAEGCKQSGAALIGGETAEMPGMYHGKDYDLAGFAVGAVERDKIITGQAIRPGDILIGLSSSGLHANGYSLVRKIISDHNINIHEVLDFTAGKPLSKELLTPTKIYVKAILDTLKSNQVKGIAHITGGGFMENIPRVLPSDCAARINVDLWPLPPVFTWLRDKGGLDPLDLATTFNCGIGMVVVTDKNGLDGVMQTLSRSGEPCHVIGSVIEKSENNDCILYGSKGSWGADQAWEIKSGE